MPYFPEPAGIRFVTDAPPAADVVNAVQVATVGLDNFTGRPLRVIDVPPLFADQQAQAIDNTDGTYARDARDVSDLAHAGRWLIEQPPWRLAEDLALTDPDHL